MSLKYKMAELLGDQPPSDNQLQKIMRLHQSWWRAFVLNEEPGKHPTHPEMQIGSSILNGENSLSNFLDKYAIKAVQDTLNKRDTASKGMISESRLYNNLLSSQPLCFNFFGRLKYNLPLATSVLKQFYPEIAEVKNILFEFAPNMSSNNDNSAHDVAIEFTSLDGGKGLIGLECKYTEPFSPTVYRKPEYEKIYSDSDVFSASYEELTSSKFNQLFRNQLIAESAYHNGVYDIVHCGLFCYEGDNNATNTGSSFRKMLIDGEVRFKIITFGTLIETLQKLDLDWETREWTMKLWARYCGITLSEKFNQ